MPLTAAQRQTLIDTVLGEAANQGTAGMSAVASVIRGLRARFLMAGA